MKDLPASRIDEAKDLIKNLNPFKTIFYYDSVFHAVLAPDDLLLEITKGAAYHALNKLSFDLWVISQEGQPVMVLPDDCPAWIYTVLNIHCPLGEILQMAFDSNFNQKLNEMTKNIDIINNN